MPVSAPASRACALAFGLATALPARSQCQDWKAGFVRPETFNVVEALAALDLGSGPALYACGAFTATDGHAVETVAHWNGSRWTAFASGMNDSVHAIAVFDIPSDLRIPICRVRSVTVVYIASSITSKLIAAATPTTTLINTFNAGTPLA